jgi:hypothetical protein
MVVATLLGTARRPETGIFGAAAVRASRSVQYIQLPIQTRSTVTYTRDNINVLTFLMVSCYILDALYAAILVSAI